MLRFLFVVLVLFALALGFQTLDATPGEVAVTVGDTVYAVNLAVAAILAFVAMALVVGLFWFVRGLLGTPGRLAGGWRRRGRDRGRAAQSEGLLAIAAGEVRAAERASDEALRRLPDEPLTLLLQAQTAQLKGDRVAARGIFQAMTERQATRIAGLRGLHVEAEREGESEAAHHIAAVARGEAPSAPWAARALLRHQTAAGDWDGALATLAGASDGRILDKRTARRQRAVLLAAKALSEESGNPDAARAAAQEAHDLAPGLVPAAVVAGRLYARNGDIRRAVRLLEATWKTSQHPEIAEAYLHVRAGDSAGDRLKRAETLMRLRPHADAARHAVGRAAIDARDFRRAREVLVPLVTERPTQATLILMAALDEAESGDRGRAREWMARAVRAPRDPAWTADGIVLSAWAPVSPTSGRLDAVEWKVPLAEIEGPRIELAPEDLAPPALRPEMLPPPEPAEIVGPVVETHPVSADAEPARLNTAPRMPMRVTRAAPMADAPAGPPPIAPSAPAAPPVPAATPSAYPAEQRDTVPVAPPPPRVALIQRSVPLAPVLPEPPRPDDPGVGSDEDESVAPQLPAFLKSG